MADHIRYDLLTQQALRGVVRNVLADAAKKGLPGEHHFYISFETQSEGVRLSDRLRAQYPEEMTIILQHQFWDLAVTDQGFEVGMSFGGIPEKLFVPFGAVTGFFDPSVQFGLQFEEIGDEQGSKDDAAKPTPAAFMRDKVASAENEAAAKRPALPAAPAAASIPSISPTDASTAPADPDPDKPSGGGEVVRLDRFRKK
ncbi:MAG: ClpXP protease specificity-enhancing factor SspB [Pseudolabrys sp.]|jgi:hypothetical protein